MKWDKLKGIFRNWYAVKVQKWKYIKANLRILSNHVQAKLRFSSHVQWTLMSFGHVRSGQVIEIGNYWDVWTFITIMVLENKGERQETLKLVVYDFWPDKKGRNSSLCTSGRLIWSCIDLIPGINCYPFRFVFLLFSWKYLWTYCHCTLLELMFLIYNWCQEVPSTSIMVMGYIMGLFQFNNGLFLVANMS